MCYTSRCAWCMYVLYYFIMAATISDSWTCGALIMVILFSKIEIPLAKHLHVMMLYLLLLLLLNDYLQFCEFACMTHSRGSSWWQAALEGCRCRCFGAKNCLNTYIIKSVSMFLPRLYQVGRTGRRQSDSFIGISRMQMKTFSARRENACGWFCSRSHTQTPIHSTPTRTQ